MKLFLNIVSLCGFAACLSAQNIPFSADALVYYPFSGSAANQLSSTYPLTVNGAALTTDRFGSPNSAYRFDGVDDYAVSSQPLADAAEFTIAAWIRPESDHVGTIFYDARFFTPGEDTTFRIQTGGALFGIADKGPSTSSSVTANNVIQVGRWQHVAITARSSLIALFVNGTLVASTTAGGNNVGFHSNFHVGAENHGLAVATFFHGSIDELIFYKRALSSAEVLTLVNSSNAPTISEHPPARTVVVGGTSTFAVVAAGASPLTYQWRKDGQAIPGATNAALTLSGAQPNDSGNYSVLVTNAAGSAASDGATLTVGIAAAISTHPLSQAANSGTTTTFTAAATGTAPLTYQWRKDGTTISGATNAILTLSSVQLKDAGNYSVMVTNFAGTVTSTPATLAVNITATISTQPTSQTVVAGTTATFTVVATGTAPFTYQWRKDGVSIPGATQSELNILTVQAGTAAYSVAITNAAGTTTSQPATLTVKTANPGRLANLSIRTAAGAGNGSLIVGFVVGGSGTTGTAPLLARAGGPALVQFGVGGALPDPVLALFNNGRLVTSNDDWSSAAIAAVATSVGAFPFSSGSKDAAISSSLALGGYSAQVSDVAGAAGVALVELYEASPEFSYLRPRLVNVSARASAASGGGTMIAGFVIKGETPITILVRAIGPGLTQFGVNGVLTNPKLTLFRDSTVVAVNDNWGDVGLSAISGTASAVGAFALSANSLDAALLATLEPGAYTAQISGSDATTTGVALVEIYEVP